MMGYILCMVNIKISNINSESEAKLRIANSSLESKGNAKFNIKKSMKFIFKLKNSK